MDWEPSFSVVGSDALVELRHGKLLRIECSNPQRRSQLEELLCAHDDPTRLAAAKDYYGPSHVSQIGDFIRAVRTQSTPEVSFACAATCVRLVQNVYRSARAMQWISNTPQ
ncbi:MAG: hypothetical protein LR015_01125 [Verrucomicrobia bacterium]|nr:hypothetical protein [Verrucomicrobiota bacterium]